MLERGGGGSAPPQVFAVHAQTPSDNTVSLVQYVGAQRGVALVDVGTDVESVPEGATALFVVFARGRLTENLKQGTSAWRVFDGLRRRATGGISILVVTVGEGVESESESLRGTIEIAKRGSGDMREIFSKKPVLYASYNPLTGDKYFRGGGGLDASSARADGDLLARVSNVLYLK